MVTVNEYHKHIFSKAFRIEYYCGNIKPTTIIVSGDRDSDKYSNFTLFEQKNINNLTPLMKRYHTELLMYFNMIKNTIDKNKYFYYIFGDTTLPLTKVPYLIKARDAYYHQSDTISIPPPIEGVTHTLLRLNSPRHWSGVHEINSNDTPFHKKHNKLIWRGSSTGTRAGILESLQRHPNKNIDIKFVNMCQGVDAKKFIIVPRLSMRELLEHKFILSIEGNDVASDLKWLLYSNSVVFMCRPTKCSWAMEDLLIPFVHYVPIKNDYSDLDEKYNWAINNLKKCNEIAQNGKRFIHHFLNEHNEMEITKHVIIRYMKNLDIVVE